MKRPFAALAALAVLAVLGLPLSGLSAEDTVPRKKDTSSTGQEDIRLQHEVTVTASPILKAVKDCSVSVSVLDETDILAARPMNALGALTRLPGIFAHRTGDFGRTDIEIRGIGQRGQRIAVLVDGRPEKMGLFGCAVTHAYPLDNVERIEVVRGPSSVLYGPDAMGGVVNVITRKPAPGFRTDLTTAYGAYRTFSLNLRHGASLGRLDYLVTADRLSSDGHVASSSYLSTAFTGRAGYDLGSGLALSLRGKYFDGNKDEPGPWGFPSLTSWNRYKRGSADISLDGKWDGAEMSVLAYADFGRHVFSDGWSSRDHYRGGIARGSLALGSSHRLSFGLDARFFGGKSYNSPKGEWRKSDVGVYLHDEMTLGRRWIVSAGARLDRDSQFGWEASPQAGIVWHAAESTALRATFSKAFRTPHINELYLFPSSNPDLLPERSWNLELGFKQSIAGCVTLDAAVFTMRGTNLIETVPNPGGKPPVKFRNTGRFEFFGGELGLETAVSRALRLGGSFSLLDTGDLTRGRPGRKIDFDVRWKSGRLQAFLTAQHVSDYHAGQGKTLPLPSYTLINGRIEFALNRTLGLFAELNNIGGEDYMVYADLSGNAAGLYEMPGRNAHFGLRVGL